MQKNWMLGFLGFMGIRGIQGLLAGDYLEAIWFGLSGSFISYPRNHKTGSYIVYDAEQLKNTSY